MVVVAGEHTVLAVDNACHQLAVAVGVGHSLMVDDALCLGGQVGPYGVETLLQLTDLIEGDGCAGISFDAACAMAGIEVTTEIFGDDVGGYQYIADLKNMKLVSFHCREYVWTVLVGRSQSCLSAYLCLRGDGGYHSMGCSPCCCR